MNFNKSPVAVTDRRRSRVSSTVAVVGGNIGKAKSALAPATSKVNSFVTGFHGSRLF